MISPTPLTWSEGQSGKGLLSFSCGRKQTQVCTDPLLICPPYTSVTPMLPTFSIHLLPLGAAPGVVPSGLVFLQHHWFDQCLCILIGFMRPPPHAGGIFLHLSLQHSMTAHLFTQQEPHGSLFLAFHELCGVLLLFWSHLHSAAVSDYQKPQQTLI